MMSKETNEKSGGGPSGGGEKKSGQGQVAAAHEVKHSPPPIHFTRPRSLPTLSYTFQNLLISLCTLVSAFFSLGFTAIVLLPLACIRTILGMVWKETLVENFEGGGSQGKGKVVLIVGASRGIGLELLKQYCPEPNTMVIAVSKNQDSMRAAMIGLGDTPATLQMSTLDLSSSPKNIAEAVKQLDEQYGPITHMYAVSGISNHLKDNTAWGMDVTEAMVKVNVSGTVALVLSMYERMKARKSGKICIVGSVAGVCSPANMISYSSTKAFLNTFSTCLRILAASYNIEVVTVQPGFINTRMTQKMRGQGSTVPAPEFEQAEEMARQMKSGLEKGGRGIVSWPMRQAVTVWGTRGLNPICEEIARWVTMRGGVAGRKVS